MDTALQSIHIPKNLKGLGGSSKKYLSISQSPFNWCESLTTITVDDDHALLADFDSNGIFNKSGTILYAGCPNTTLFEGITTIKPYAFCMDGIESIALPKSVTTLSDTAFLTCNTIRTIYVNNNTIYSVMTDDSQHYLIEDLENIYILASADDGSNTYLSDTTNYPYQYKNITVDGEVYNLYSKVEHSDLA